MIKLVVNMILGGAVSSLGSGAVSAFNKLGFRGTLGVLVLVLLAYFIWSSDRDKRALKEKQHEVVMQQEMILELQKIVGATVREERTTRARLDSAKLRGAEYSTNMEFWKDRTEGVQGVVRDMKARIKGLEKQNDSLRKATVKCFDRRGRLIDCPRPTLRN
jgi:hypothetical protein